MVSHAVQQKHAWRGQSTYNHDILLEEQVDSRFAPYFRTLRMYNKQKMI